MNRVFIYKIKAQIICISNDNYDNKNDNNVYIYEFEKAVRCKFSAVWMQMIQIFWVFMQHSGDLIFDILKEWSCSSECKIKCY